MKLTHKLQTNMDQSDTAIMSGNKIGKGKHIYTIYA